MRGVWVSAFVLAVIIASPLGLSSTSQTAAAQSTSLALTSTTYYIIQGDNDLIEGDESSHDFAFLRILSYRLPHNVSRVHMSVPSDARNITTWVASQGLIHTTYGWETSGTMEGRLYIDVPSWFERSGSATNTTNNSQSILAPGSALSPTLSYDSGALHLVAGASAGTFVSAQIPVPECVNISSANVTLFGTLLQNVTCEVSNDHGTTWIPATPGTNATFHSEGTGLLVRLGFQGDDSAPTVTGFQVAFRYLLESTIFTVHLTYAFEGIFQEGTTVLDLTEPVPYESDGSSFLFLYLLKGYSPEGVSISLSHDEDGDPEEPDKDVFVNMSLSMSGSVSRSILVSEPKTDWTFALVLVLVFVTVGGAAYVVWKRNAAKPETKEVSQRPEAEEQEASQVSREDLSKRRSELISRKEEIAAKIEEINAAGGTGETTDLDSSKQLDALRAEYRKVRNELNRISKKAATETCENPSVKEAVPYESVLASIARLDEDFEKGRLSEKSYRAIRKEYVSKAAALLAAREAGVEGESPLEREKTKLMEAILALEEEHKCGEVDAKVYQELEASYRKELAALLERIEHSREE